MRVGWRRILPSRPRNVRRRTRLERRRKALSIDTLRRPSRVMPSKYLRLRRTLGVWSRARLKRFTKKLVRRSKRKPRLRKHTKNFVSSKAPVSKTLIFGGVTRPTTNYAGMLYTRGVKPTFSGLSPLRRRRKAKRFRLLPRSYITRSHINTLKPLSHQTKLATKQLGGKHYVSKAYRNVNLSRLQSSIVYKQYRASINSIFKKSLFSRSANFALRRTLVSKLRARSYSTQSYLRPKKIKRFTYRGVSSLSYRVLNKLSLVSGGMQASSSFAESGVGLQKQLAVLVFQKLFWLAANPVNLISTQHFLYQPAVNLRRGAQYKAADSLGYSFGQTTHVDQHKYYNSLSAKLLRCNSTLSQQELSRNLPTPTSTYPRPHSTKGYSGLGSTKQSWNYAGDQFFYNSIQSYLMYRNSLKQHLATSKTASLILSFETRSTRLNTLPIFLELKQKPFGSDIKPTNFLTYQALLSNQARQYFSSFLNPMTLPSIATWKSNHPYVPLLMRPVTLNDRQLKSTRVGPKVEPLRGIKIHQESEVVIKRLQLQAKYSITRRITKMYLTLLGGDTLPTLLSGYKRGVPQLLRQRKLKNSFSSLASRPFQRYTRFKKKPRLIRSRRRKFRFRRRGKRTPQYNTRRLVVKSFKRRIRKRRFRGRKFFRILRLPFRFKQRRTHLNLQQKHVLSDFTQGRLNPDFLITRKSVIGFKKHLITPEYINGGLTRANSNSSVRIFGTQKLLNYSHPQLLLLVLLNPFLLKVLLGSFNMMIGSSDVSNSRHISGRTQYSWHLIAKFASSLNFLINRFQQKTFGTGVQVTKITTHSNLLPSSSFSSTISKYVSSLHLHNKIREDFVPLYFHTLVRFVEAATGKRFILQFYPFLHQSIPLMTLIRYKQWIPKMKMYERRLGHKFFFEESLHLMHLSFALRDAVLFSSWLKTMIRRISFWKTRLIFRFLRYLFINFFSGIMPELKIRGIKIKLKGKISVGGNSRKRTIFFRSGESSYSRVDLRVSQHKQTIGTFTGVQGLQLWIFY